jgi:hypothetical protein
MLAQPARRVATPVSAPGQGRIRLAPAYQRLALGGDGVEKM